MFTIRSHYEHETTNIVKGKELHQQIVLGSPPYQLKQYLGTYTITRANAQATKQQ